jgi:hypothetical protein
MAFAASQTLYVRIFIGSPLMRHLVFAFVLIKKYSSAIHWYETFCTEDEEKTAMAFAASQTLYVAVINSITEVSNRSLG